MELQEYIRQKLGVLMGWGQWGYAAHRPEGDLPHTPGEGGLRFMRRTRCGLAICC
jgi:hypothetical protein